MRIRSFVSSAAIVGGLLASSALVSQAVAQKGTFMTPSTSWAVNKVEHQTNPYCALAKKFNQNTVLTLARNSESETSLALDFQQPVFSTGQSTKIMLDPGAGQQRVYTIRPVSDKAFVVRLGRDGSFFEAMERTGMLRVEVDNESFHFNVSDIDTGQTQLDTCIATSVMPAAGDEEPFVGGNSVSPSDEVEQAVSSATQSFRAEINTLRREINALKEKNNSLRTQLDTRSEGVSEVSSSVKQLSAQLRQVEDENAKLRRQVSESQTTAVIEADTESLSEIAGLQKELETIRREKLSLEAKLQSGEADSAQILKLMDEIKELKTANTELEAAIASPMLNKVDGSAASELESQIAALEEENERLSSDILSARETIKKNYEAQLASLEKENRTLRDAQRDAQKAPVTNSADAALVEQLRQEIGKVENENRLLKETSAQASAKMRADLEAQHRKELAELKATTANDIASLEKEIERLLSTQEAKDSEIAAMDQQLETIEKLREEKQALQDELAASMATVSELKAEKGQALAQADAATQTQSNVSVESQKKIADLHQQLTGLENTNTSLKRNLDEIKAELDSVTTQNEELRVELARKETRIGELGQNETKLSSLQSENAQLKETVDQLSSVREENDKLRANEGKIASLETENSKLRQKANQLEALKAENEAALQNKQDEIARLKSDFAQRHEVESGDDAQFQQQLAQLEEQKEQLKTSLGEVIQLAETLKTDNEQKAGLIATLTGQNETLTAQNEDLQSKIDEQAEKIRMASQAPQKDTEEEVEQAEAEPVRSVVLGDVAATTVTEATSSMKPREPAPEPEPEPKAQPKPEAEQKMAKAVPVPSTKPSIPAAVQAAPQVYEEAEPVVNEVGTAEQPAPEQQVADSTEAASPQNDDIRKIDAAMAVIEEEMRNADPSNKEQMQRLARQYAYLNAQRSYLTQETPDAAQDVAELSSVTDATDEEAEPHAQAVNEAQAYEASLKSRQEVVEVVEQQEVEPITVSQSVDPFAEMSVENEDGEVLAEAVGEDPISEVVLDAPDGPPEALERFEQPAAVSTAGGDVSIEQLVTAARVSSPEKIKRVEKTSDTYDVAYQWNGGSIYGSAEQKTLPSPGQFDNLVQDYLERTQSRCPGEFAIVPDSSVGGGALRADSYEVACVGDNVSSGASLLFFNKGGTFTVVAHEAPAAELDNAISMRNQVRRVVTGG